MKTLTRPAVSVKPSRKPAVVTLALAIDHICYAVTPITGIQAPEILKAFRLEKKSDRDAIYDVARESSGLVTCTCPDATFRREGLNPEPCKHGRALIQLGLLDAPVTAPSKPEPPKPSRPGIDRVRDEFDEAPGLDLSRPSVTEFRPFGKGLELVEVPDLGGLNILPESEIFPLPPSELVDPSEPAPLSRAEADAEVRRAAEAGIFDGDDAAYKAWMNGAGKAALARRPFGEGLISDDTPCCSPSEPEPCAACLAPSAEAPADGTGNGDDDSGEDEWESDPSDWPAWTDDATWEIGPEPVNVGAPISCLMTLDAWVDRQAGRFRLLETQAGDLVAFTLAQLAESIRFHGARTPREFDRAVGEARLVAAGI